MIGLIGKRKNEHRKDFVANMAKMPFVILWHLEVVAVANPSLFLSSSLFSLLLSSVTHPSLQPFPAIDQRRQARFPPLIFGGWRVDEWDKKKQKRRCECCEDDLFTLHLASVEDPCFPHLYYEPYPSKETNSFLVALHAILTPSPPGCHLCHPISFGGSWEQGTAPDLTCLDTSGLVFCPQGRGEEEDGAVWMGWWGGYVCRLKVKVGGWVLLVN